MSDFAPLYTTRERVVLMLKLLAVAIPVYLLAQYWFFPWLKNFAAHANCFDYGWVNGVQLVMYGIFIFIPLSLALLIWLLEGRRGLKVLRMGQNPLPGEKVLRKTRYRYGRAAKLQPYAIFIVVAALIGASVWGGFQAAKISSTIAPCSSEQLQQLKN